MGSTVSYTTGECVACNVTNCSRCDYSNACSQYSPDLVGTNTPNTTGTPTNASGARINSQDSEQTIRKVDIFIIVALAIVIVLLLALAIGFFYLLTKTINKANTEPEINNKMDKPSEAEKELNETAFKFENMPSEGNIMEFGQIEEMD